jgi:hypothetical protein
MLLRFLIYSLLFLIISNCAITHPAEPDIRCEKITETYPIIQPGGTIAGYDTTSVKIYYYKNLKLYDLEYHFDSSHNGELIVSENRRHYLLCRDGDSTGYDFDDHKSAEKRKVQMDSVYSLEWVFNANLKRSIFANNLTKLISSKENRDSGIITEQYSLTGKEDTLMKGFAVFLYSTKLKDFVFSLSNELDNAKKAKLFKVNTITYAHFVKEEGFTVESIETSYLLERESVQNPAFIKKLFKEIDD